jgi:DmsE family decaheme c-type cytochrome
VRRPGDTRGSRTAGAAQAARLLAAWLCALSWLAAPGVAFAAGATYIGADACKGCHQVIRGHFAHTRHALAFEGNPRSALERRVCEACHGPGSAHRAEPAARNALVTFQQDSDLPRAAVNGQCLQCHAGGGRLHWSGSIHARNDLFCSDCHNPMARYSRRGLLRKASANAVCVACHKREEAEFRKRSHMPLHEGKQGCVDCHNPHGSASAALLKADSVNQLCYGCHQEQRGPFLWEHAPVRDDCRNCHLPHGSNHDFLLKSARPFLCQQCHSAVQHVNDLQTVAGTAGGSDPDARVVGRSCQNCHAQVHGSNHPAGVRLHR